MTILQFIEAKRLHREIDELSTEYAAVKMVQIFLRERVEHGGNAETYRVLKEHQQAIEDKIATRYAAFGAL